MADPRSTSARPEGATGVIVFADGRTVWGRGFGAEGSGVGELCFNTAMTGYQEVMTDPSYARQVVAFTFPHIGNVGANEEDVEAGEAHALGCFVREAVTGPSNFRSTQDFPSWMAATGRIGVSGVDTRALTHLVRREGPPTVAFAHDAGGEFDLAELQESAKAWPGLEGMDLAKEVSRGQLEAWSGGKWSLSGGDEERPSTSLRTSESSGTIPAHPERSPQGVVEGPHVVAIDYGAKRNIFRLLVEAGARVTIFPAGASFEEVMAVEPDGFFLSNGPGDPAATGEYAVPLIRQLLDTGKPLFGICLGHQLLALAVGGKTAKMFQGHRGANHPVKRLADGAVEITSMNHGFAVEREGQVLLPTSSRSTMARSATSSACWSRPARG